jgi:hypothetical protein
MMYQKRMFASAMAGLTMLATAANALAEDLLKPYVMAYTTTGDVNKVVEEVKGKVTGAGFEIAGSYSPFADATILVVTNDELKKAAASSDRGGYVAGMRVTVTKQYGDGSKDGKFDASNAQIQVAFTNPVYWANAYRVTADVSGVKAKLAAALGSASEYGSFYGYEKGISAADLRGYHYTVMMEYFDDPSDLGEHDSHADALKAVEDGLAAHAGGTSKVYRIDIPGKEEAVFGVAMTKDCSGDEKIMKAVDMGPTHNTGYAPYEILVSGNKVEALYARFRIAIAYLGLPMMANATGGTFMDIMCAPNAIEEALLAAAGEE